MNKRTLDRIKILKRLTKIETKEDFKIPSNENAGFIIKKMKELIGKDRDFIKSRIFKINKKIAELYKKYRFLEEKQKQNFIDIWGDTYLLYLIFYNVLKENINISHEAKDVFVNEIFKNKKIKLNVEKIYFISIYCAKRSIRVSHKEIYRFFLNNSTIKIEHICFWLVILNQKDIYKNILDHKGKDFQKGLVDLLVKKIKSNNDIINISKPQILSVVKIVEKYNKGKAGLSKIVLKGLLKNKVDNSKSYNISVNSTMSNIILKKRPHQQGDFSLCKDYISAIKKWNVLYSLEKKNLPILVKSQLGLNNHFVFESGVYLEGGFIEHLISLGVIRSSIDILEFRKRIRGLSKKNIIYFLEKNINNHKINIFSEDSRVIFIEYISDYLKGDEVRFLGILPYIENYVRSKTIKNFSSIQSYTTKDFESKALSSLLKDKEISNMIMMDTTEKIYMYFDILFSNNYLNLKNRYSHSLFKNKQEMVLVSDFLFVFIIGYFF